MSSSVKEVLFVHNGKHYEIPEEYSALVPDEEICAVRYGVDYSTDTLYGYYDAQDYRKLLTNQDRAI